MAPACRPTPHSNSRALPPSLAVCVASVYGIVQAEVSAMCRTRGRARGDSNETAPHQKTPVRPKPLSLQRALHATPAAAPLLALAAAATLGAVLPLIVYCGAAGEFEAGFHPLTPRGYAALAARTYGAAHAARGAGGRVEGKDL